MGLICCGCFHAPEVDEENAESDVDEVNAESNGSNIESGHLSLNLVVENLINKYQSLFGRGVQPVPSSYHGSTSSQSTMVQLSSSGSSSAPAPSNASLRDSQLQQDVVVTRHEKGSGLSRLEPELPLSVVMTGHGEESKECHSMYPMNVFSENMESKACFSSEEDEDCPICLEEYTTENPKIITQCSHHYHLSCIYEWKERSQTCPVCSKLMVFEEMT